MKYTKELTEEEFFKRYAKGSGTTVAKLKELGQFVEKCACGEGMCQGWKMSSMP